MKGGDFIMLLRKSFIILITILALSVTGIPVDAQSDISRYDLGSNRIIQPYYTNILTFDNGFSISSSGQATFSSYLVARNVNSVKLDVSLQRYNNGTWQTIKDWTTTSSGTSAGLSESYYVSKGYTYRTVSSGYVYQNGRLAENSSFISNSLNY
jgi:hypothetical protein